MNYELITNNYKPVIGLEVHVELKTKSKMFCRCSADHFAKAPNTQVCPVCLGLPGALPVPNKKAIEWCVMIGLALNCEIPALSKFDRKNYFYPDLPKGYQISQYDRPFCINGHIVIGKKTIRIRRVHMEEDTAKLIHQFGTMNNELRTNNYSLIDFNRSGVPLVEIVTEPDFESADEVVEYLKKIQQVVRYLDVSDADMEKGQMRLEPNISLKQVILATRQQAGRPESAGDAGQASMIKGLPPYKVEVKNINSFRFVEKAINYEIDRQRQLLEKGETPRQETRGWSEEKNATLPQRGKEEAHDYRYFPEPDIPPIRWGVREVGKIREGLPELPDVKLERFKKDYALPDYDTQILVRDRSVADYFEECARVAKKIRNSKFEIRNKDIANWIINKKIDIEKTLPAQLLQMIISQTQTTTIDETKLEEVIKQVLLDNAQAVSDYKHSLPSPSGEVKKGKVNAINVLIGAVMRKFKEKIDAKVVREKIIEKIKEEK